MSENTMKCPFWQDERGEFLECYMEKCMAYVEIQNIAFNF